MRLRELLEEGTKQLLSHQVPDAKIDASLLLFYICGMDRSAYFMKQDEEATPDEICRYRQLIEQRCQRIPLQHLTGEAEFMGLSFEVNKHVLIPRQDTECLVEEVLQVCKDRTVLDLCTGSGCIAISIAALGTPSQVSAVDVSRAALQVAERNIVKNQVQVELIESDLFANCPGRFDILVSNPPYIETEVIDTLMPEVREHEPMMALDGSPDGLFFYRKIIYEAREHLQEDGHIFLEIGYNQGEAVCDLLREQGFEQIECKKDLGGLDRIVMARVRKGQ